MARAIRRNKHYKKKAKNKSNLKIIYGIIGGISFIIAIIGFYLDTKSKIDIYTELSLKPEIPFATPFIVKNESLLPIYNIEYVFGINLISTVARPYQFTNFSTKLKRAPVKKMSPGDKISIFMPWPFKTTSPITYGDIEVKITYRQKLLSWRKSTLMRFTTYSDSKGNLKWLPAERID